MIFLVGGGLLYLKCMLHVIFNASAPLHPQDPLANRIQVTGRLWESLQQELPEYREASFTTTESIDYLIGRACDHLHPHIGGIDMYPMIQYIMTAFGISAPADLQDQFFNKYFNFVYSKIMVHGKNSKKKHEARTPEGY